MSVARTGMVRVANDTADRYGVIVHGQSQGWSTYFDLTDRDTGRTIGSASRWANGSWHAAAVWTRCTSSIGRAFRDLDGCIEAVVFAARTRVDA